MAGVPPVKNEAFTFYCALTSQANTDIFQANPTLAAGDVQVSIDGGAFNNLGSLPTVSPAAGEQVEAILTAGEMNGDVIGVLFSDVAGNEWQDLYIEMFTDSQQIGDIPTAATIATAVWAAGTRTLTAFGTLAADVWAYATRTLTQSASQVAAAVQGSDISVNSYVTWSIALTSIGDISDRTALYFTAKKNPEEDTDAQSIVQIEETLGLLYIGGAAASLAANGSITVADAVAGDITITVNASVTGLRRQGGRYGVKKVTATGVTAMCEGSFEIDAPPGRAVV